MNRKKLVDVIEQVLTPVDEALNAELRKHLERTICNEASQLFSRARHYDNSTGVPSGAKAAYDIVKPVLDDCIDRLMVPKNDDA